MSFQPEQQQFDYPVHRPALQHRITPRHQKEMTENQVIVPSMSAALVPPSSNFAYYHAAAQAAGYYHLPPYMALPSQHHHPHTHHHQRQVVYSTPIHHHHQQQQLPPVHHHVSSHPHPHHYHHQQQQHHHHHHPPAVAVHPPIHHTLENATITYDTVAEHSLQRDLVKDVFFSPAMARDSVEPSSSGSSISSQSDSESDSVDDHSSQQDILFSPHVSPSDLLQDDDPLFFIGLDFAEDETKKPTKLSLRQLSRNNNNKTTTTTSSDLPTPPASVDFSEEEYVQLGQDSLKRHRNRSTTTTNAAMTAAALVATKKLKVMPSDKMTPPASPGIEYFDDASAEESSDEEDEDVGSQHGNSEQVVDPVFYSYHPQAVADFQSISAPDHGSDDNESTSSWEDIQQQRADIMFDDGFDTDSTSDEEEEAVLPFPPKQLKQQQQQQQQQQKRVVRDHREKQSRKKSSVASVHNHHHEKKQQPSSQEKAQLQEQEHVQQQQEDQEGLERADCRPTAHPTIYQKLTKQNVDWCRYCGTTEGVNWRPGPWGKRTLCNKHGCDYKGYGFACKLPRLDLTGFAHEAINDRDRPVLQLFCSVCHRQESWAGNVLVRCEGCPKAMHQKCAAAAAAASQDNSEQQQQQVLTDEFVASDEQWFCDASCHENARRKRIVVELPRKRLPLMCAPKNNASSSTTSSTTSTSSASSSLRSSSSSTSSSS